MNRIIFLLAITATLLLHSCINKSTQEHSAEATPIVLDFEKKMKSVHDIDLIKDVDIISLDCDEVIIGNIDKVIKFDTIIYLMDRYQNKSIYLFNLQGDFIRFISKHGQGPDEYVQLTDMFIDPIDSTLNIVSSIDKKLLKYDLTGEVLRVIEKNPKPFKSMKKMDKGYLGYMGNHRDGPSTPFNLWILNEDLEITDHFMEINEVLAGQFSFSNSSFSVYKDINYFITPRDYSVYLIADNQVKTKYVFDLGKLQWPKDIKSDELSNTEHFQMSHNHVSGFSNFQETDNHLLMDFILKGQSVVGVYNKENKEANIVTLDAYTEKYFFDFGSIIGFDENTIYTLIDAEAIKTMWDGKDQYNNYEEKYPTQVANLRKKFKTVREDGNPFLVMYSIN